ncbi:MAG: protease 1 precursor [Ilumatobacteraceae bacterium]|nr:protease 1 precursor [Ilumatobacteraceae bacterium]
MTWDAPTPAPPPPGGPAGVPSGAARVAHGGAPSGRRRLAVLTTFAVAVVAGVGLAATRPWSAGTTDGAGTTVWASITSDFAADGRLTAQAALEAFAYVYGVDLPGVRLPAGSDGNDRPTSASGVVRWVRGRWQELTAAQRDAVERTLADHPADVVTEVDLTLPATPTTAVTATAGTAPASTTTTSITAPASGLRTNHIGGGWRQAPQFSEDDACGGGASPIAHAVCSDVVADIARIGPRLGMRTIHVGDTCALNPICQRAVLRKVTIRLSDDAPDNTFALTQPFQDNLTYSPCNITVYSSAWSGVDPAAVPTSALHEILTHEVVHCYQNVIFANNATAEAMPPWITEGSALWLASDDTHIEETMVASQWRNGWLGRPTLPLLERTYDAFGWYSLLDQHRWDLWAAIAGAWRAAAAAPSSPSEPFIRTLDGDDTEIREAWAPSIVRDPNRGAAWETYGFGLPADARAPFPLIRASSTPTTGELAGRAAILTQVRAAQGEVVEVSTTGLAAASDGTLNMPSFTSNRFCTIKDCTCPKGTRLAGTVAAENNIAVPFMLSFSAPAAGSSYAVTSESLDALCGKTDPLPPSGTGSPGPCARQCAASNGDPHMVTVDGHRYDFQAAGEFVLLRDPTTGTEIQARQEPLAGSAVASINTEIAARAGDHRVSVSITGSGLEVRVDGKVATPASSVDLGPGAHLAWAPGSVEIGLPDGTTLWALGRDRYGLVVQIAPSDALRQHATGLLGPVVPGGAGLPALPDGTRLARPVNDHERFEQRYVRLAGAWRVEASTSLLDHPNGRTTAGDTTTDFPDEASPSGLAELDGGSVAAAMTTCTAITDAVLWGQCVYDVALTADGGFAQLYARAEQLLTQGFGANAGRPPTPAPSPAPSPAGSTVDGPLRPVLDHLLAVDGSALTDDGTLYVSVQLPGDDFQLLAIDTVTSQVVERVHTDGGGPVILAGGSVWLGDATLAGGCAVARFDPRTLAETGRLTTPCWLGGVQLAPLADAVWYLDVSGVTADATGAHLVRIDAGTITPGVRVEVPTSNGHLTASRSAIFYGDDDHGTFTLVDGATGLQPVDGVRPGRQFASGDAIWQQVDNTARRFHAHDTVSQTIDIDGTLIAASDDAIYVELASVVDAKPQLWRYPLDGTAPTVAADGPSIGTGAEARVLTYADDPPILTAPGWIVKVWTVHATTGGGDAAMFLQATRP